MRNWIVRQWRTWQYSRWHARRKQGFGVAMGEFYIERCDVEDLISLADEMVDGEESAFAEGVLLAVELIQEKGDD